MNVRRALAGGLLALVAFAFSSIGLAAPAKQFSIAAMPGVVSAGQTLQFTLTIKNEVPNGNSNFNSITINLPSGLTLDATQPVNVNWGYKPPLVGAVTGSTSFSIQNMAPVNPLQTFTITLYAKVNTTVICQQWTGTAYTGSSLGGDTFAQIDTTIPSAGSRWVSNTNPYTIAFGTLPTSVVTNPPHAAYSIGVTVANACVTTAPNAAVTLSAVTNGSTGGISPASPITQNTTNGTTTFNVSFLTVGQTTLTATAPGFGTTSITLNVFDGTLNCGDTFDASLRNAVPPADLYHPGYAVGQRGQYNKDGLPCLAVNYTTKNTINAAAGTTSDYVVVRWDMAAQPDAAVKWSVNWGPVLYDPTTGLPFYQRPRVAWLFDAFGAPTNLHPALACLTANMPAPYGRLSSFYPGGANQTTDPPTITLDTTNPPAGGFAPILPIPFPITVVGTYLLNGTPTVAAERMQVTGVSGNILTVSRNQVTGAPAVTPFTGGNYFVMSTPLPTVTVTVGTTATTTVEQMCIIEQGFTTYTPDPSTGAPRAFWSTTVIDIGDGYVQGNF